MYLRNFHRYCRLCGVPQSLRPRRRFSELLCHYQIALDGYSVVQTRSFSEKIRDPKNFRWVTGRPDDPPRIIRTKMGGSTENMLGMKEPSPSIEAVEASKPEKWVTSTFPLKGAQQPYKAKQSKMSNHSGPPKRTKFSPLTSQAVDVGSTKGSALPQVMPTVLEKITSPHQKLSSHLEDTTAAGEKHNSDASAFLSTASQPMPDSVASKAISVENPEAMGRQLSDSESPKILEVTAKQHELAEPIVNNVHSSETFQAAPKIERPGSSLLKQVSQSIKDTPEKTEKRKRSDISVPMPPAPKVVKESFDETNRHRVYSFGLAETGALGFHKPNEGRRWRKYMPRPLRHQFAEENRVISAESGYGFTLFYVQSDSTLKLYGCGLNSDFQLGPTDDEVVTYPSPVDIRISSPKTKIVSFSAGRAHSVVATDKEGVFLLGSNIYGQCGRAIDEEGERPSGCVITQIKGFAGEKVQSVTCGQDHTCFVTESGKVYSCGWGSEGQTGQGHCMHVAEPSLVAGDIEPQKIVKVASKCDTVLALNGKGDLFGWGSNEFKQLVDDPDVSHVDLPIALGHVNSVCGKIIDVAAGSSFCLILNQERDVYVWGYGILGGGPNLVKTATPTLLPRTLFGSNHFHPLTVPTKVFCGVDHMAIMNNLKHVYAWGKNKHGCLGIGNARDQYFPYKLAISADAIHVSCAVDHSVVVTDHD